MRAGLYCLPIVVATLFCLVGGGSAVAGTQDVGMTFDAVPLGDVGVCSQGCPIGIVATGQITQETPARFLDFLRRNVGRDLHAVVFIDSPGGKVLASMEFGTLLRKVGATMIVAGLGDESGMTRAECFSACVYALMGARKRVIPTGSLVGIHRMFVYETGMAADGEMLSEKRYDDGQMRAFLMRYSSSMGVSPGLIAAAERVPPDELRILTPSEIRRWHLGVPRP